MTDLDSPMFAARQEATAALRQLGPRAIPALRQARDKPLSAGARRRAADLLAELERSPPAPDELRALRAVEVLEWVGTPEARRLLTGLGRGDPDAPLTRAAGAALGRLR